MLVTVLSLTHPSPRSTLYADFSTLLGTIILCSHHYRPLLVLQLHYFNTFIHVGLYKVIKSEQKAILQKKDFATSVGPQTMTKTVVQQDL